MRRMIGMYKLPFWDSKKYTPLQAHQWNQWLDEHPNQQHRLPVPRTPDDELPPAPDGMHAARFYAKPDYNRKAHQYHWDVSGNISHRININDLHRDELQGDEGPGDEEKSVEPSEYSVDLDSRNNETGPRRINISENSVSSSLSGISGMSSSTQSSARQSSNGRRHWGHITEPAATQQRSTNHQTQTRGRGAIQLPPGRDLRWLHLTEEGKAYKYAHFGEHAP